MEAILTVTDLNRQLCWEERTLAAQTPDAIHQVSIFPAVRRQRFEGFGGAFTEAAAYSYQQLPEERRRAFMEAYFGTEGLGYTLGRVHIGSCDFALGNYACLEGAERTAEQGFNTERDDQYLLPMILDAQKTAKAPIGLLLTPWSPPAFMKTNGEMNHGGSLKEEYRRLWAGCMAYYAAYYRKKGCGVRRISIQNEPAAVQAWDSCIYSAAEEGRFAADYLLPALKTANCADVRIFAWDHNKEILPYRAQETLSVPGAQEAVAGFAVHWYTGDHFEAIRAVKEKWPGKEIWFTEGCVEYSRFDGMTPMQKAEMYAHDILGNLNAGISGSIDWNLLLDAKGGPNHVGNFCEAPIMLNADGSDYQIQSEYYYIGHFSRFIRPGAVCLASSAYDTQVEAVAFENPDKTKTAVLLNRTDLARPVSVTQDAAASYNFVLEPHTIATLCWK